MSNEWIDEVIRDIAEMDDRDSPPDWPEAMLVTADELKEIITRHAPIPVVSLSDAALRKITSVKIERLPEDTEEARDFRAMYSGPLYGVHSALRIWALTHSFPQGSQAKVMACMANVVAEHIDELENLRNPWKPMKSAPKDGTAVLVLLEGSDIPHPARWIDGWWQSSWDNHRMSCHDGPRAWMAIPTESMFGEEA